MKKKKKEKFVHLHNHSDMSLLDGGAKIEAYVEEVARRGSPAIAFTDHGTMRGYYKAHIECEKKNIKPIHGVEFYVANDMRRKGLTEDEKEAIAKGLKANERKRVIKEYEEKHGIRDRLHLTAWAINNKGLKNLFKLTTLSFTEGFYYKPRIDLDTLIEHSEGLAVGSGCAASVINDRVNAGKKKKALAETEKLLEAFGENFWIEVQPHAIRIQRPANEFALFLKKRFGKRARLLATQDVHYISADDARAHEVLLCIGTNDYLSNPNRFKFTNHEFFMKTRKEMFKSFMRNHDFLGKKNIIESLNNTLVFADKVNTSLKIDYHAALLPDIDLPDDCSDEWEYIRKLCLYGWKWRNMEGRIERVAKRQNRKFSEVKKQYKKQLSFELKVLYEHKFIKYFLVVHDLYKFARNQKIKCGPGRGSAAGSLVSFLLGITSVDPIEHDLMFERFISPGRNDLPDIDMDFEKVRRQEIIDYLFERYGRDRVAQIATLGKLSGKQVLKDVSRVLEVPYVEVNQITSCIVERAKGDERVDKTIEDSFAESKILKKFGKKYPDVPEYAQALEGMNKTLGIHAAGIVVSPEPLTNYLPLEVRKHEGENLIVTALDMKGVAAIGLVKLDVLGLRFLTVIRECLEEVEKNTGKKIDLEADVDLNDMEVLKMFTDQDFVGVFQFDSTSALNTCKGVVFDSFKDIVTMNALNRPGTTRSGLADQFVERKKNPKLAKKDLFHPSISKITSDTLGVMVFQEHVIKIFVEVAGFKPSEADKLRKAIGKSEGDKKIAKEKKKFVKGAIKKSGLTEVEAEKVFKAITRFGSYGFNKSHATAYSMTAFWCMYLKKYFPLEFYWAHLKNEPQLIRIQRYARDAKQHGIEILPPDVSESQVHFKIDRKKNAIRGSLLDIKGVGEKAAETIIENQPYKDTMDLLDRVDRRRCHKGVVVSLAKSGALDQLLPNTKWFIEHADSFFQALAKSGSKEQLKKILEATKDKPDYSFEERQLVASKVNPLAFGEHPIAAYEELIKDSIKIKISSMSDENFFDKNDEKAVYVCGVIVKVKGGRVGDFHTGDLPDEIERERMNWGAQYASVYIEDKNGTQRKIKFDYDVFDEYQPIIDAGAGTPVVVCAVANRQYKNMRALFAVDLEDFRKRFREKGSFNLWQKIISGEHPAFIYPWKTEAIKKGWIDNKRFNKYSKQTRGMFCGLITNVKTKKDKRGSEMAFFGLLGAKDFLDVICFGSYWSQFKKQIEVGKFLIMEIERSQGQRGVGNFFNGGYIKSLKNSAASTPKK